MKTFATQSNLFKALILVWGGVIMNIANPVSASCQTAPAQQWELQMASVFETNYNAGEDWFYTMIQTSDGGYLAGGYTNKNNTINNKHFIPIMVKFDNNGKFLWEKDFVPVNVEVNDEGHFDQVLEVNDGYVAVGPQTTQSATNRFVYWVKVNKLNGSTIASQLYGNGTLPQFETDYGAGGYTFVEPVKLPGGDDDGFIIGSTKVPLTSGNSKALLIRLENNGTLRSGFNSNGWQTFPSAGPGCAGGEHVTPLYDASSNLIGYALAGTFNQNCNAGYDDAYIVKTGVNGGTYSEQKISESSLGASYTDINGSTELSLCGGGSTDTYNEGAFDIKQISNGGDIVVTATFDIFGIFNPTCPGYVPGQDSYRDFDGVLIKLALSNLSITWAKNVDRFTGVDYFINLEVVADGFLVTGSEMKLQTDPLAGARFKLVKTDLNGIITYSRVYKGVSGSVKENCMFDIAKTDDGGFIIGGNNDAREEDYYAMKLGAECLQNQTYDVNGYYYPANGAEWTTDKKVAGRILIQNGVTFTIKNCTVQFADPRQFYDYDVLDDDPNYLYGITVQKGGKLIVNNATLSGMNACGVDWMWEGINVEGNPVVSQSPSTNQGQVEIKNGAIIKNARNGVNVDGAYYYYNPVPLYKPSTMTQVGTAYKGTWSNTGNLGGGIVSAVSSTFLNCRKDVGFAAYHNFQNISSFTSCAFTCNALLADPNYRSNGVRFGTTEFVSMYDTRKVSFKGCTWNGYTGITDYNLRGIGISSVDADYTVQPTIGGMVCSFSNLNYGINASAASGLIFNLKIEQSTFSGNQFGILATSITQPLLKITQNTFSVASVDYSYALYLNGCTGYTVEQNTVNDNYPLKYNYGFAVNSSGKADNLIYNNTFNNVELPSLSMRQNWNGSTTDWHGLVWKCNKFNSTLYAMVVATVPGSGVYSSVNYHQGECVPNNPTTPAGNSFNQTCGFGIICNVSADAQVLSFNYNHHNNIPFVPVSYSVPVVTTVPCGINSTEAEACPLNYQFSNGSGGQKLAEYSDYDVLNSINDQIDEVAAEYANSNSDDVLDQLQDLKFQQSILINKITGEMADDSTENAASIADFLLSQNRVRDGVSFLMVANNFDGAETILDTISIKQQDDADFVSLNQIQITLGKEGATWFKIDGDQEKQIRDIATHENTSALRAQAILHLVYGEEYPVDLAKPEDQRNSAVQFETTLCKVYPNPTDGELNILLKGDASNHWDLHLVDIWGRQQFQLENVSSGIVSINLETLTNGIYFLHVARDGLDEESHKVQVTKEK